MFFKKKITPEPCYKVLKNKVAKYRVLLETFKESNFNEAYYFFENTCTEVSELLKAVGLTKPQLKPISELSSKTNPVLLLDIHPLKSVNDKLLSELQKETQVDIYVSFDDPVLAVFMNDRTMLLMEKIGMKENEPIEHQMISKSIVNAQKKIEQEVSNPRDIKTSAEDWFTTNYKVS